MNQTKQIPFYSINFKMFRKIRGYTQETFAKEAGMKRGTYAAYEEGRTEPPIGTFFRICYLLRIKVEKAYKEDIMKEAALFEEEIARVNKKYFRINGKAALNPQFKR